MNASDWKTPPALPDAQTIIRSAHRVIAIEAASISALKAYIGEPFVHACRLIMACKGRLVVTGMGKSGHVARKIAATLASTGTPSFHVHPGEAGHGDLGMIIPQDIVLAVSNSGETDELLCILPLIKRQGIPLIAITSQPTSSLAGQADIHLDARIEAEACPLGLAPTTSTTAALVMGDALAIALLEMRGFTSTDFAHSHPAGSLGRRLLRVSDIMRTGQSIPTITLDASLADALLEMTRKQLGMTAVVDADHQLLGIFTDGDLRRALEDNGINLRAAPITTVMTHHPKSIGADRLAIEAVGLMEKHAINALLVVDTSRHLVGATNFHDLLMARIV